MAALLIAAHGLVAQLSAARLADRTGAPGPDPATRDWVQVRLASEPDADDLDAPPGPLAAAALGLTAAARNYDGWRRVKRAGHRARSLERHCVIACRGRYDKMNAISF